ncbi:MAG: hypothetical protein ABL874_04040 [Sphingopyxis sp.]
MHVDTAPTNRYKPLMIDIADLEVRLKKAKSRAEKARIAFDSATSDVTRLETTLSVVKEIMGGSTTPATTNGSLTKKQQILFNAMKIGQNNAMQPSEIYSVASQNCEFGSDINYVRSTLWRMASDGVIGSANRTYWRIAEVAQGTDSLPTTSEAIASVAAAHWPTPVPNAEDDRGEEDLGPTPWDDDSEVPF